jgi:hypothetical protein
MSTNSRLGIAGPVSVLPLPDDHHICNASWHAAPCSPSLLHSPSVRYVPAIQVSCGDTLDAEVGVDAEAEMAPRPPAVAAARTGVMGRRETARGKRVID